MAALTDLANRFHTDKGTTYREGHGYTPLYELLLEPYRALPIRLMEIGLAIGGPELKGGSIERTVTDAPSVRMWREYFPQAHIYGVDISDFARFQTDWFTFFRADCGDEAQLDAVVRNCTEQMDIILDDGSHASFHQQLTLAKFLPLLKSGGLYIIEDMSWQPLGLEASLPKVWRTDRLFQHMLRHGGKVPESNNTLARQLSAVADQIGSIFLFDEDTLYSTRRFFNLRTGGKPDIPNYLDAEGSDRYSKRGYARRILEEGKQMLTSLTGDLTTHSRPRIKLAVLKKK